MRTRNWAEFEIQKPLDKTIYRFRSSHAYEAKKKKNNSVWIIKEYAPGHPLPPVAEVLAAELYRLFQFGTYQPKTRLINKKDQKLIASKKIDNFKPLNNFSTEDKQNIHQRYVPGFSSILVISLLVGQLDLNDRDNGTILVNGAPVFVHFDDNNTFYLSSKNRLPYFSANTLRSLPFPRYYHPRLWLDILDSIQIMTGEFYPQYAEPKDIDDYKILWENESFQQEKFFTIANIIFFPQDLIKDFIDYYLEPLVPVQREEYKKALLFNIERMRIGALQQGEFITYLIKNKAIISKTIITLCLEFKLEGKQTLLTEASDREQAILEQIEKSYTEWSDPAFLLGYPHLKLEDRIKGLVIEALNNRENAQEVINFYNLLKSKGLEQYEPTPTYARFFHPKGGNHLGRQVLKACKERILSCSTDQPFDKAVFDFLNIHSSPFALGLTQSAQAYLERVQLETHLTQ